MATAVNPKTLPADPPVWTAPEEMWFERYCFPSDGKGSASETSRCITAMRRCVAARCESKSVLDNYIATRCGSKSVSAKYIVNAEVRRRFDSLVDRYGADGLMDAWREACDRIVREGDDFEKTFDRLLSGKWDK